MPTQIHGASQIKPGSISADRVDTDFAAQIGIGDVVSVTANYSVSTAVGMVLADTSGGSFTITLPEASLVTGRHIVVKKTDASGIELIIDGYSSETIDGNLSVSVYDEGESVSLVSNGVEWKTVTTASPQGAEWLGWAGL